MNRPSARRKKFSSFIRYSPPQWTSSATLRTKSLGSLIYIKRIRSYSSSLHRLNFSFYDWPTGKSAKPKTTTLLTSCFRTKADDTKLTFCNGVVLDKHQCQRSFGDWLFAILDFCQSLHAMDIDISAFACLCALALVTGKFKLMIWSKLCANNGYLQRGTVSRSLIEWSNCK